MVQLKLDQLRRFISKNFKLRDHNTYLRMIAHVVTGNVPVKISNNERFETAYKYLITQKPLLSKKVQLF